MEVMSSRASKCSLHRLKNIDENTPAVSEAISRAAAPETPTESMEFLARSWSVSAAELSKALSNSHSNTVPLVNPPSRDHDHDNENGGDDTISINILKESLPKETSPPISPRGSDEMRELFLLHQALNPDSLSHQQQQLHKNGVYKSMVRKKTMKRWARDQREQKKHEIRTQNAQVHAAVSVAGVAAAVAALAAAAATFPETSVRGNPAPSRTSAAMASAAGVVASHCIEIAEEMGADHDQISAVVNSAVNARTNGDIMALTAAAATALRGASILKTRMQRGYGTTATTAFGASDEKDKVEQSNESNHILSSLNFVSCGRDLLKRTRKGDLHWKQVSFSINSNWQVVAKMKSTYMGGTFTKKKKCVVSGVSCDVAAWAGRAVKDGSGERRTYFGIRTSDRVIEFECRNKDEKLMWTHGIQHMLNCHPNVPLF